MPIAPRPWVSDTAVVVLPSPALVGVTPVTQTSLPSGASAQPVERGQRHLRLVAAVGLDLLGHEAHPLGDRLDREELGLLRDLEAALHLLSPPQWLTAAAASSETSWSS